MYIKEIKDMINLMNDNGLTELEVEKEGLRICLKKGSSGIVYTTAPSVVHHQGAPMPDKGTASGGITERKAGTTDVKAPMVGTFYKAPSPDAPAYVNVGDVIEPGQVICIIEAMKLMNEIKSEVKGKIVDIQVDNAEPVEFGQVLFVVEPV